MTIETDCPQCGKSYRIKDEMAGKRFRCKQCQGAVTIPDLPANESADADDAWNDDFLGEVDSAASTPSSTRGPGPPPIAGRSKSKSKESDRSSRRPSKSGGGGGLQSGLKVVGGLIGGVAGFVIGYLVVRALMGGGAATPPQWQVFTPPGGTYRVELPGPPLPRSLPGETPGAVSYFGETSQFACAVTEATVPPAEGDATEQQRLDQRADDWATRHPGATVSERRPLMFGDHPAREMDAAAASPQRPLRSALRMVIAGDTLYALEFVTAGPGDPAARDRFFNSFQILDASRQPSSAVWGAATDSGTSD